MNLLRAHERALKTVVAAGEDGLSEFGVRHHLESVHDPGAVLLMLASRGLVRREGRRWVATPEGARAVGRSP